MPSILETYRYHILVGLPVCLAAGLLARRCLPASAPTVPLARIDAPSNDGKPPPAGKATTTSTGPAAPASGPVAVHVAGCVRAPGVYSLPDGARVNDAVKRAGGAKPNADLDAVNLAARIQDGAQIYIPSKGESPARGGGRVAARGGRSHRASLPATPPGPPGRMLFTPPAEVAPLDPPPPQARSQASPSSEKPQKIRSPAEGRVNINRADAAELQRLPHVGPATAEKILEYRETHGAFTSVDELLEVRGIGDKRLAEIRDLIEL